MRFCPEDLLARLDAACTRRRESGAMAALLLIGMGRLNFINWNLGFGGGEAILDGLAARLGEAMPECLQGEPWPGKIALLAPCADAEAALSLAHRVVALGSVPYRVGVGDVFSPPYVGVVMVEPHSDAAQLLRDALFAMEDARSHILGNSRLYDPSQKARIEAAFRLESALREGFETGDQFTVAFQPLLAPDVGDDVRVLGFEALARWTHPTMGVVRPDRFIPVAEAAGLILGLGNFVLWEACRQQVEWRRRYGTAVDISVNLSPVQLMAPGIDETIAEAIAATGIDPKCLKLEITETALAAERADIPDILGRLRATGIAIGVDDFGSGYSSLGQLDRFGLDFMKIDKKLIQRLGPQARQTEVVRLSIALAKHLGMKVIAEGIETAEQLAIVTDLGADIVQGYYFSKPQPPELAAAWLEPYQVMSAGTTTRSNSSEET